MKKTMPYFALVIAVTFILIVGFQPRLVSGSKIGSAPDSSLPDSIMKIVQKSCIKCHSNNGSAMAKMKVNFDSWDSYGDKKQSSKAKNICDELTKGKMPPKGYRESNPNAVPTDKEIKTICAWAASFQK